MSETSDRWETIADKYTQPGDKSSRPQEQKGTSYVKKTSVGDAIDSAKVGILAATGLAEKVKASFKKEGDFEGGSVSGCVESALGASVAQEFGLTQGATHSVSLGMGSSSQDDEDEK